jgi:hypothetical protein
MDGAIECFQKAVQLDPDHAGLRANLDLALKTKAARNPKTALPPREVAPHPRPKDQ